VEAGRLGWSAPLVLAGWPDMSDLLLAPLAAFGAIRHS
jgi:hypothetical protein